MDTMVQKSLSKLLFDYKTQIYRELICVNEEMKVIYHERLEIAHNYPFVFSLFERGSPDYKEKVVEVTPELRKIIGQMISGFQRESELTCNKLYRLGWQDCLLYVREIHVSPVVKGDDKVAISLGGIR